MTPAVFLLSPRGREAGGPHGVALAGNELQPLKGTAGLGLRLAQWYEVVRTRVPMLGPWKVRTASYIYAIEDVDTEEEIFAFHWHPDTGSVDWPHMHVGGKFKEIHIPTGRVAIEQVIRLAVDMGAEPVKSDWEQILDQALRRHVRFRTWP